MAAELRNPPPPSPESLLPILEEAEAFIGAPKNSVVGLMTDSDWSLVIKAHAMVESACTSLLAGVLDQRLRGPLSRLELSRSDCGKVVLLQSLGLLSEQQRRFIRKLSELRNALAHDAANLQFDLSKHFTALNSDNRRNLLEALALETKGDARAKWLAAVEATPQAGILLSTMSVVLHSFVTAHLAQLNREQTERYAKLAGEIELPVFPDESGKV